MCYTYRRGNKLMFIVIGARDFSPEITVHLIGTKVPCFDKVPPPQIPILRFDKAIFFNCRSNNTTLHIKSAPAVTPRLLRGRAFSKALFGKSWIYGHLRLSEKIFGTRGFKWGGISLSLQRRREFARMRTISFSIGQQTEQDERQISLFSHGSGRSSSLCRRARVF